MKDKETRKKAFQQMHNSKTFNKKIVIIGYGAIGTALLHLLLKIIRINLNNVFVIDKNSERFLKCKYAVNKIHVKLSKDNTKDELITKLQLGQDDIIIDCSYEINTNFMFALCSEYGISYVNSAVEVWSKEDKLTEEDYTFYQRIKSLEDQNSLLKQKRNNFIISLGCNPGNVNLWTLYALEKINKKNKQFDFKSHAELASKMGLRVIHISERDSQISKIPKNLNEYVNTWSLDSKSWYDEAFSFLEISWGTHEKNLPLKINKKLSNEYQLIIDQEGATSLAYSYTPIQQNYVGMLVRHEECFTIAKKLTLRNDSKEIVYKPSCYYVYKPCDSSFVSTYEVIDNYRKYQKNKRLMTDDIIKGNDELGCTLFFEDGEIWWFGSLLDIEETRFLFDNEINEIINATILQVITGYLGGILYLIDQIEKKEFRGLLLPEDLPIKEFVKLSKPFLGPFGLYKVDNWTVETNPLNKWQFNNFTY
jgi:homospermidine synthase